MIRALVIGLGLLAATARAELAGFATDTAPTTAGTIYAIGHATGATPDIASRIWAAADTTFDALTCTASQLPGSGNSWTMDVWTAGALSNSFADQTYACVIDNTHQHCVDNGHSAGWAQDGSLTFSVTTVGTPPSGTFLTCAVRVAGNFALHMEAILVPVTGTATAYGSFSANVADDYQAMQPVEGTFTTTTSRLTCMANQAIPSGSLNIRVRHGTGPTFGWSNSPINCAIPGVLSVACQDLVNTQALGGQDGVSYRLTPSGTIPTGLIVRCGLIYTP